MKRTAPHSQAGNSDSRRLSIPPSRGLAAAVCCRLLAVLVAATAGLAHADWQDEPAGAGLAWGHSGPAAKPPFADLLPALFPPDITEFPTPTPLEGPGHAFDPPLWADPVVPPLVADADCAPGVPDVAQLPPVVPYKGRYTVTWLPGDGDALGMTDVVVRPTLAFPRVWGLTATPEWAVTYLDGPTRTDLPPRLYTARIEVSWMQQLRPTFGYEVAVMPGVYGDLERSDRRAFRIIGRALGFYTTSPRTQWVFGGMYLDRDDAPALPAFGAILTPHEDLRAELLFPQPKVAACVSRSDTRELWTYVAGEFGGGQWAIVRANGRRDVMTYGDLRLLVGLESRRPGGCGMVVEGGYVFGRSLEYRSGLGDFDPRSTAIVRCGMVH